MGQELDASRSKLREAVLQEERAKARAQDALQLSRAKGEEMAAADKANAAYP